MSGNWSVDVDKIQGWLLEPNITEGYILLVVNDLAKCRSKVCETKTAVSVRFRKSIIGLFHGIGTSVHVC